MTQTYLKITGDIHGKVDRYSQSVRNNTQYSLQIGDLGFNYNGLSGLDPAKHKFFGGNHDNYDVYYDSPHSLGDYGMIRSLDLPFYFIRGAFSIDVDGRIQAELRSGKKSWWKEETLPLDVMYKVYDDYKKVHPKVVITHTCPTSIARIIGNGNVLRVYGYNPDTFTDPTSELLQQCLEAYPPKVWIFGHFHQTFIKTIGDTLFICLNIGESLSVNQDGTFNHRNVKGTLNYYD